MRTLQTLLVCALSLGVAACADETDPAATDGGGLNSSQSLCDNFETEYDDIVTGLVKAGDNAIADVKYVGSSPAPPAEDDNRWTVQLLDTNGAPLADAIVTDVRPWMPEHGHGTTIEPVIGTTDSDGMVEVTDIDFRMPGVWTLTFTVQTDQSVDTATFGVCIE